MARKRYHWIKFERRHTYFPFDRFTVYGRVDSENNMIGYITKEEREPMFANIRYGIYKGNHALGVPIGHSSTLVEAKAKIIRIGGI